MTPPDGLRRAAILLDTWAKNRSEETLVEAFSEICAVHDVIFDHMLGNARYGRVVRERVERLRLELEKVPAELREARMNPGRRGLNETSTERWVRWDGALDSSDDPEPLMTSLAEAMVCFDDRIGEIAKPLSDGEIESLVQRCRREAHPQPGDSHNFEIPAWDDTADQLQRELTFRRIIYVLVLEECMRKVSGTENGSEVPR